MAPMLEYWRRYELSWVILQNILSSECMARFIMMSAYEPKQRNIAFIKSAPYPPTHQHTLAMLSPIDTRLALVIRQCQPAARQSVSQWVRWRASWKNSASWKFGNQMTSLSIPVLYLLSIVVAIALLESKRIVGPTHPKIAPLKSKRIRGSTHPAFPLLFSPFPWKYCIVDPPTIQVITFN